MRKALLMVSALSLILWRSVGIAEAWKGNNGSQGIVLIIIGVLLYGSAFVLFGFRFFQWHQVLARQKINLDGLNFFKDRRNQAISTRSLVTRAFVFVLPAVVSLPLSVFQPYMDATIVLALCLIWPLSLLFYALLSKDFQQIEMAMSGK